MILLFAIAMQLTFQNHARRYLLHVPATHGARMPLVIVFHGGTQTPEEVESQNGFDALADREGFLVAYPAGIEKRWADGRGSTDPDRMGIDDVGFTRAMIADIRKRYPVDEHRIYATGASNGGVMSNRLGCEMADVFAAIAPVIGTIASNVAPRCTPSHPISVLGISGVDDPLMPFGGGEEGGPNHRGAGGRVESVRATQQLWARVDHCDGAPSVSELPTRVNDGTSVTKRMWSQCRGGTEVVWYEIAGGGHRWPGHLARPAAEPLIRRLLGVSSQNLDATRVIWEFFKSHHL